MMKQFRPLRATRVKHSNITTATASATAAQTARDKSLATEWGNAWREITEAADQLPAKYVLADQHTVYDGSSWGKWTFLPMPDVPITPSAPTPTDVVHCGREGRSINIKSVEHMCFFNCVQDALKANCNVSIRVVWFVNKVQSQSDAAPPIGDVFNNTGTNLFNQYNEGFLNRYQLNNQDNYLIISDEIKTFTNRNLIGCHGHFTDHIDLDLTQTWNDQNTDGQDDKSVTNAIWCGIFPIWCDNLPSSTLTPIANGGPGTGTFALDRMVRMTYIDA